MRPTDVYVRKSAWSQLGDSIRLRPADWHLLEQFDGKRTLAEIIDLADLDPTGVGISADRLLHHGLIEQIECTWSEYVSHFRPDVVSVPGTPPPAIPEEAKNAPPRERKEKEAEAFVEEMVHTPAAPLPASELEPTAGPVDVAVSPAVSFEPEHTQVDPPPPPAESSADPTAGEPAPVSPKPAASNEDATGASLATPASSGSSEASPSVESHPSPSPPETHSAGAEANRPDAEVSIFETLAFSAPIDPPLGSGQAADSPETSAAKPTLQVEESEHEQPEDEQPHHAQPHHEEPPHEQTGDGSPHPATLHPEENHQDDVATFVDYRHEGNQESESHAAERYERPEGTFDEGAPLSEREHVGVDDDKPESSVPLPTSAIEPTQASDGELAPLRLRELLDFVIQHAGGGTKGQLAVYRIFLKVPTTLLRDSGIRSLNVVTSDLEISDPTLRSAILAAVEEVLGEPYPV